MPDLSWAKHRKLLRTPDIGFNAEVYRHFKINDLPGGGAALRDSLLIGAKDSRSKANFKIQYFRDQVQKVHLKPTIIGQIKDEFDESVSYKCQVQLYFRQDSDAVPSGKKAVTAQISFRLDETHKTITETNYKALANKIKVELAPRDGYLWNKGKILCLYNDEERGYRLQIYALSEAEGEQVVKKILSIQDHPFDEKLFRHSTPKRNSENTPGKVTILGTSYSEPRWRPTATVRFMWADLIVWNVPEPICLVDNSGIRLNPVLRGG